MADSMEWNVWPITKVIKKPCKEQLQSMITATTNSYSADNTRKKKTLTPNFMAQSMERKVWPITKAINSRVCCHNLWWNQQLCLRHPRRPRDNRSIKNDHALTPNFIAQSMERKVWPITKVISRLVKVLMAVPAARVSLQQHVHSTVAEKT
jgi:hypothetical protein